MRKYSLYTLIVVLVVPVARARTYDGPAELPLTTPSTAFPDTTGYVVKSVCLSGACDYSSPQTAVDNIQADGGVTNGEIITLHAGDVYEAATAGVPTLSLPYYALAPGKWVIIETDTADPKFPGQGVRVDPSDAVDMPKITDVSGTSGEALVTAEAPIGSGQSVNHYWLLGLEFTMVAGSTTNIGPDLALIGQGETEVGDEPQSITLDRCYFHGPDATSNVHRQLALNGNNLVVMNSYFGMDVNNQNDSQNIASWNQADSLLIQNNFLHGATEDILFGGSDPAVPNGLGADVTITHNYLDHDLDYWPPDSKYNGVDTSVKDLLELKECQRCLIDGNILEYSWYEETAGAAILFTPVDQDGQCTACSTDNLTLRYNLVQHASGGICMVDRAPGGGEFFESGEANISIHDNVFYDIDSQWGGTGQRDYADSTYMLQINGSPDPVTMGINQVTTNHNTFIGNHMEDTALVVNDDELSLTMPDLNFIFTNNIVKYGGSFKNAAGFVGGFSEGCNSIFGASFNAQYAGNVFVSVPAAAQSLYGTGDPPVCALPYPRSPFVTTTATGGSIRNNTSVYVQITYVDANGDETAASYQQVPVPDWTPIRSYTGWGFNLTEPLGTNLVTRHPVYAIDSNNNLQAAFSPAPNGSATSRLRQPVWNTFNNEYPVLNSATGTCAGVGLCWQFRTLGQNGTIRTCRDFTTGLANCSPVRNTNTVTVTPVTDDVKQGGVVTGYNVYASTVSGAETEQNGSPIPIGTPYTLTTISTSGAPAPSTGTLTVPAPAFVCGWPADWAALDFVDYATGDVALASNSPCKGLATDGTDPGANVPLVSADIGQLNPPIPTGLLH